MENHELIEASTALPLQNPNEKITAPKKAMQTDLMPELPSSGGYERIVTVTDMFSRQSFAYLISDELQNNC